MSQNETFQAKVIAALSTPGGEEAVRVFQELDKATRLFEGDAKKAAESVAVMVKQVREGKKSFEDLQLLMQGMGEFLKTLNTAQKTKGLFFSSQDVKNILDAAKAIKQASDAFQSLEKSRGISKGNLGMDSRSIKETNDNLKLLQTNLNAVNLAVQKQPANTGLYLQKVQIENNIEALKRHRDALELTQKAFVNVAKNYPAFQAETTKRGFSNFAESAKGLTKVWTDVSSNIETQHNKNIKAGLSNYVQTVRSFGKLWQDVYKTIQAEQTKADALDKKRDDARFRVKEARDAFFKTVEGGNVAFGKYNIEQAQRGAFASPGYVPSKVAGVERQDTLRYLKDAYAAANTAYKSSASMVTDTEKVKNILTEIVRLENLIVASRRLGRVNLAEEAEILKKIGEQQKKVSLQRQKDRSEDPSLISADRGRQTQNMLDRITGESGGALLAVQASLMANYSILNSITNGVKLAITYSLDLEAAFKNIQAVTATTGIEMRGLEKAIKDVAGTTKFNAKEIADAALILGQAGLSAKQVSETISSVAMLATASGTSLEQAVDIVTSVVGVFNVTTSETADVANKITQAVNVSKLSIDKLALGFQYAGNTAAQLGVSFEEVTAAMAAMSNAGIKSGSTMGTGLRQLLIELQNPTEEFIATLRGVGLTLSDLDLKTQSFSEVLRKLRDAGFVASDAIKSFDVRGAAAFNALLANPEMMDQTIKGMNESKAAVAANDIQMESLKNQILRLNSAFGNLVSTGLTPVSEALSIVVGGLASAIQAASNMTGVVEILGTALVGALGAAAASMISTTLGNLVAIAPRLIAMGAAAPALASVGTAIMSVSTAATTATGVLGGLSLLLSPTGIGVAIAAVTGLYFIFSGAIESNKEKLEAATASLDRAKGSLNEQTEAVESLNKKIDELESKSEFLRKNQDALAVETTSLISKFGQFGFSLDAAGTNVDTLIGSLRNLRNELRQIQGIEMQNVAASASALAAEKERQAREEASSYTGGFFKRGASAAQALTGSRRDELAQMLASEGGAGSTTFKLLESYSRQLAAGKSPESIPELASVSASLNRLVSNLESKVSAGTFKGSDEFANVLRFAAESTRGLSEKTSAARVARQEAESARLTAEQQTTYDAFLKRTKFEEKINVSPNISQLATKQLGEKASPTDLYRRGVVLYGDAVSKLTAIGKDLDKQLADKKIDPTTAAKAREQLTIKSAEYRRELETLRKGADPYLKLEDKDFERSYQAESRMLARQGKGGKNVLAERIALERKRADQMITERLRDVVDKTGPEAENIRKEINQQIEFKIQEIQEEATQIGGRAVSNALELTARSLEAQAANAMKASKVIRGSVRPQDGFDQLGEAMDQGLKKIAEAKALELKATAAKIRAGQGTESDIAAVKEKYELASEEFINSFRDLYGTASKKFYDLSQSIKKSQTELAQLRLDADAREFDRNVLARELKLRAATEGKVGLKAETRQAELNAAGGALTDVRQQQTLTAQLLSDVTSQLQGLKSARLQSQESFQKYSNLSDVERGALSPDQKKEMFRLEADIKNQTEAINDLERLGIEYQKEKRSLLNEEYELKLRIAQASEKGAKPVDISTYRNSLQRAISDYKEDLKQLNPEEMISDGFYSMLGNLQNGFSTFFTDVVTGAKSAEDAFRNFAISIVRAMLDIVAQQAAIALIKSLFGMFGGGGDTFSTGNVETARHGGEINRYGKVQTFARGGSVRGGTPGRDSVPALVMPGEFVLRTSAVDAVGTDFLHALNNAGNSVVSSTAPAQGAAVGKSAPTNLNIWVVTPDQQPTPGAKDIVAVVTDDIARGGSIKQMVKQVQVGAI